MSRSLIRKVHTLNDTLINRFRRSPKRSKLLFGEVLRKNGVITYRQLEKALNVQINRRVQVGQVTRLGQIIVELGYATEQKVLQAINRHYRISAQSLSDNLDSLITEKKDFPEVRLPRVYFPIWLQFSVTTTVIITLTILVLGFINIGREKEQLYLQTVKTGMVSLSYFSNNARIPLLNNDILRLNTLIKEAASVEGILYVFIIDHTKVIKAHTDYNKIGLNFNKMAIIDGDIDTIQAVDRQNGTTHYRYTLTSGEHVLALSQPITVESKALGHVSVGLSLDFLEQLIHEKKTSIAFISLFIMGFGISIAVLLGFGFSRPIKKLVDATREIGKGNYQYKVNMKRNDELGKLAGAFDYMTNELWLKSLIQESFGKYVGPEVLDMIIADPESMRLKGQKGSATILFSDIRRFTTFSEAREPEEVVEVLNKYFDVASQSILRYGGYIDKFLGDGVLGVFGVPIRHDDHVERAVRAAVDMQSSFRKLSENGDSILSSLGVGINSGVVVSGSIGSQVRMEYTVIGDTVNVASRLNGLAGAGEIIISHAVYEKIKDILTVQTLPLQPIRGKTEPVQVYKVLGIKDNRGGGYEQ
ncbi:MAG: HAMP domain-containing protein [Deltaproteobacteria bacterium]|nr:HAMP domain-containing protein [Deltaproteobacteria bacterium]